MGSTNWGAQLRSVGFYDPADSGVVNRRNLKVQERGIYNGGYVTRVSDTSFSISPLTCIVGDSSYQLRIETTVVATITGASSTNKYVVLRWAYTGASATDYMDILSIDVGSIQANDVIVGVLTYAGSTMTGIDYNDSSYPRTEPRVLSLFGKVEAEATPTMYVRVRACNITYGSVNYKIANQRVGIFTAPASNPRIDVVYIDTDGVIKVFTGTENASPVAPDYTNKIVLAEIRLSVGATTITQSMITDVRSGFGGSGGGGSGGVSYSDLFLMCGA